MWASLLACLLVAPCTYSVQWCYQIQNTGKDECRGPSQWFQEFPDCGGQRQSPINIVSHKTQPNHSLTPIIFKGYTQAMDITVTNNGYSVVFNLFQSAHIRSGGLPATYKAVQCHLHWRMNGGSEHTVDGEQYSMELHIVHIKEQYTTLKEAMEDTEGVAGLGIMFEVSSDENHNFNKVIEAMGRIPNTGNTTVIRGFKLTDILTSEEHLWNYYRYLGSLTVPGCHEPVIWTIFQKSVFISHKQLANITQQMFHNTGKQMTDTLRPVQNLHGRVVYRSIAHVTSSCDSVFKICGSGSGFLILLMFTLYVLRLKE